MAIADALKASPRDMLRFCPAKTGRWALSQLSFGVI